VRSGLAVLAFVASLAGCAIPVTDDEITWRYPDLSGDGCPNLTGRYLNNKKLFTLLTGGLLGVASRRDTSIEDIRPLPSPEPGKSDRTAYFTRIRHTEGALEATLIDEANIEYARGRVYLDHAWVGCYKGAMILRRLRNIAKAESASGLVDLGEIELRKLPDGGLQAVDWSSRYLRSNWTGKATTRVDEKTTTWTFGSAPH